MNSQTDRNGKRNVGEKKGMKFWRKRLKERKRFQQDKRTANLGRLLLPCKKIEKGRKGLCTEVQVSKKSYKGGG